MRIIISAASDQTTTLEPCIMKRSEAGMPEESVESIPASGMEITNDVLLRGS